MEEGFSALSSYCCIKKLKTHVVSKPDILDLRGGGQEQQNAGERFIMRCFKALRKTISVNKSRWIK
jgi:hypothetical protein